jgi:hypothetical protein
VSIDHQTHSFSRVWHTCITTARVHQIIRTEVAVFRKQRIAYACSAARDLEPAVRPPEPNGEHYCIRCATPCSAS